MQIANHAMKSKRGRRCKLTSALQRDLCRIIALPCTIRSACESCNISESTFNDWIRRGETGEEPFSQFSAAITRARGVGKVKIAESILNSGDERVKLEYLARVYPAEFGRTSERLLPAEPQVTQPPPPIIINVTRGEETEKAVKLFGNAPAHLRGNDGEDVQ